MVSFPNAKINLGLNILSKREDGFHNISSCFYPIDWNDILEIVKAKTFSFSSTGIDIPGSPNDNLCVRAYNLLKRDFGISPVQIHLHKIIPIGAGLGGGSSDGTHALKMLNNIFNLGISNDLLANYASQLGSDCPFFIENKPKFVSGTGDIFSPAPNLLKDKYLHLVYPEIHVTTAKAYQGITPQLPELSVEHLLGLDISLWQNDLVNDFETGVFKSHPELKAIKINMYKCGALYASMSGTGSTIYGIFDNEPELLGSLNEIVLKM